MVPHPFDSLGLDEVGAARQIILDANPQKLVDFREIYLREPAKDLMKPFLDLEHAGKLNDQTPRPPRLAKVQFDVIAPNKTYEFHEASVDLNKQQLVSDEVINDSHHANLTVSVCQCQYGHLRLRAIVSSFKHSSKLVINPLFFSRSCPN